jgi:hypothetical protein
VTYFSAIWIFLAPIRSIGDLFFRNLDFSGANMLYWGPVFPQSGFFGRQYILLMTCFSAIWIFRAPINPIDDLLFSDLNSPGANTPYW